MDFLYYKEEGLLYGSDIKHNDQIVTPKKP